MDSAMTTSGLLFCESLCCNGGKGVVHLFRYGQQSVGAVPIGDFGKHMRCSFDETGTLF